MHKLGLGEASRRLRRPNPFSSLRTQGENVDSTLFYQIHKRSKFSFLSFPSPRPFSAGAFPSTHIHRPCYRDEGISNTRSGWNFSFTSNLLIFSGRARGKKTAPASREEWEMIFTKQRLKRRRDEEFRFSGCGGASFSSLAERGDAKRFAVVCLFIQRISLMGREKGFSIVGWVRTFPGIGTEIRRVWARGVSHVGDDGGLEGESLSRHDQLAFIARRRRNCDSCRKHLFLCFTLPAIFISSRPRGLSM